MSRGPGRPRKNPLPEETAPEVEAAAPKPVGGGTIRVRAVLGDTVAYFDGVRIRDGEVFTLRPREVPVVEKSKGGKIGPIKKVAGKVATRIMSAEEQFSERWMVRVDESVEETAPVGAQAALDAAHKQILDSKRPISDLIPVG